MVYSAILETHKKFWEEHPALLFGLLFLIGASPLFLCALGALYLLWISKWRWIFLLALASVYSWALSPPHFNAQNLEKAYFSIQSLQPHVSPFHKGLLYKGTLRCKEGDIPCSIYFSKEESSHPPANRDYLLSGSLNAREGGPVVFKPKKWVPVEGTFSWAEMRYQSKEKLKRFLHRQLPSPRVAALLNSLITGDVEERSLRYEFGRLGLQHILAISGLHFALLAAFCSVFLNLFLSERPKLIVLFLAITAYFLFVGPAPAVQRSWIAAVLYLLGHWMRRRTTGLNLLGIGLAIEVILNPAVKEQIGFQLSFVSCAGILLLYPLIEKKIRNFLPKRSRLDIENLPLLSKHIHWASATLRHTVSLSLAVNLALLPLLLYHFQQFPLLSLLYNLFIPFCISLSFFLTLLSLLASSLWMPLSHPLFFLTDRLTDQILNLIAYPPVALDYVLAFKNIPTWTIPLYLAALFCTSLWMQSVDRQREWGDSLYG